MDFDERLISKKHVSKAIDSYLEGIHEHRPARSAFLLHKGKKLPAKYILRLAFFEATGKMVKSETLTGGKASVRVLTNLGFNAIYEKQESSSGKKNLIKSVRREAFRQIITKLFGEVETERKFSEVRVPDFDDLKKLNPALKRVLEKIQSHRGIKVEGQVNRELAFDFFVPKVNLLIEFDERQHFTPLRAASLQAYPDNIKLGFDRQRWIDLSKQIRAGDNSPIYRDEQRAFYDSVRDIVASQAGLNPVVRIYEEDVLWEKEGDKYSPPAQEILKKIKSIVKKGG